MRNKRLTGYYIMIILLTMKTICAMEVTFITCDADYDSGFFNPLGPAYNVLLNFSNGLFGYYPHLRNDAQIFHYALLYNSDDSNTTDRRLSDHKLASMLDGFYQLYYDHEELFPTTFSSRFTVFMIAGGIGYPFDYLKSFFRDVPVFVATVNPEETALDRLLNPNPSTLNLVPSRNDNYYVALETLATKFNWTKMTVICDCDETQLCPINFASIQCEQVNSYLNKPPNQKYKLNFAIQLRLDNISDARNYEATLDDASDQENRARVILLLVPEDIVRKVMINAYHKNMASGDYVFITIQPPPSNGTNMIVNWKLNDTEDEVAAVAFKSLIVISKHGPDYSSDIFQEFLRQVSDVSLQRYHTPMAKSILMQSSTVEQLQMIPIIAQALERSWDILPNLDAVSFLQNSLDSWYSTFEGAQYLDLMGVVQSLIPIMRFDDQSQSMEIVITCNPMNSSLTAITNQSYLWFGHETLPSEFKYCEIYSCFWEEHQQELTIGLAASLSACACLLVGAFVWLRRKGIHSQYEHLFMDTWTHIKVEDATSATKSVDAQVLGVRAEYEHIEVYAKKVTTHISEQDAIRNSKICAYLFAISDLKHEHVTEFYGVVYMGNTCYLCSEFCQRGSLRSLLLHNQLLLDTKFRLTFMADVVEGLNYIHKSVVKFHGGITSTNCLVSSRFSVKLSQTGYSELVALLTNSREIKINPDKATREFDNKTADIRNVGLMFLELLTNYTAETPEGKWFESVPKELQNTINSCLKSKSSERPTAQALERTIRRYVKSNSSITSLLMSELEKHADSLQGTVVARTHDLVEETKKVDALLSQMLPLPIIAKLRNQETIVPEMFESATILFSDIPVFSEMVSHYTPLIITQFLNSIYSTFDETLVQYDVYKVETINDSYVVVSGVPVRNENKHAAAVCFLALRLRDAAKEVQIPSADGLHVNLRIGINTGPVAAGIMGTKMPRYCLFGDTMNTASRMESHGREDQIHLTTSTKNLSNEARDYSFEFEARGLVEIKGKGQIETYWLIGGRLIDIS